MNATLYPSDSVGGILYTHKYVTVSETGLELEDCDLYYVTYRCFDLLLRTIVSFNLIDALMEPWPRDLRFCVGA